MVRHRQSHDPAIPPESRMPESHCPGAIRLRVGLAVVRRDGPGRPWGFSWMGRRPDSTQRKEDAMPYYMYVALQEDNKIAVLTIDAHPGPLTPQGEVPVPGGPFTLAISPDRQFLYAGCRDTPQISSFAIHPAN